MADLQEILMQAQKARMARGNPFTRGGDALSSQLPDMFQPSRMRGVGTAEGIIAGILGGALSGGMSAYGQHQLDAQQRSEDEALARVLSSETPLDAIKQEQALANNPRMIAALQEQQRDLEQQKRQEALNEFARGAMLNADGTYGINPNSWEGLQAQRDEKRLSLEEQRLADTLKTNQANRSQSYAQMAYEKLKMQADLASKGYKMDEQGGIALWEDSWKGRELASKENLNNAKLNLQNRKLESTEAAFALQQKRQESIARVQESRAKLAELQTLQQQRRADIDQEKLKIAQQRLEIEASRADQEQQQFDLELFKAGAKISENGQLVINEDTLKTKESMARIAKLTGADVEKTTNGLPGFIIESDDELAPLKEEVNKKIDVTNTPNPKTAVTRSKEWGKLLENWEKDQGVRVSLLKNMQEEKKALEEIAIKNPYAKLGSGVETIDSFIDPLSKTARYTKSLISSNNNDPMYKWMIARDKAASVYKLANAKKLAPLTEVEGTSLENTYKKATTIEERMTFLNREIAEAQENVAIGAVLGQVDNDTRDYINPTQAQEAVRNAFRRKLRRQ